MRMRHLLLFPAFLLLASCTQNRTQQVPLLDTIWGTSSSAAGQSMRSETSSSAASSDVPTSGTTLEFGDAVDGASSASATSVSPLTERIGQNGTLELGAADAPATLVLFTHHACKYCRDVWESRFPRLKTDFLDAARLNVRIIPLTLKKYPESAFQAAALVCGTEIGRGADVHSLLFGNPKLTPVALTALLKLDKTAAANFRACLTAPETLGHVEAQQGIAAAQHVTLVPTFVLLKGDIILDTSVGLLTYADLRGWIEATLR